MSATFSLATERWLPVLDSDHGHTTASLVDVFTRAPSTIVAAGGHLEDAAVHRLLLAVTYAALGSPGVYPEEFTPAHGHRVAQWLTEHADQFDLLHPQHPFLQTADTDDLAFYAPGLLDPTLGRSRPRVTDARPLDARPTMSFGEAAILLLVQQQYSSGGLHPGASVSLPQSPGTKMVEFRPVGTTAQVMSWARIPVDLLGEPTWSWRDRDDDPQVRGSRPDGELDALTWLGRRIGLRHEGNEITGAAIDIGWRRAPEADATAPFDHGYGRRGMAVAASSVAKPVLASMMDGSGYRSFAGDPVNLVLAWERGGDLSLSGQIRAALDSAPDLDPPRIVATGQQVEDKSVWAGAFTTEVPCVGGGFSDRAQAIVAARPRMQPFNDAVAVDLLTDDALYRPREDEDEAAAKSRIADAVVDALQLVERRPATVPGWPFHAVPLFRRTTPQGDEQTGDAEVDLVSEIPDTTMADVHAALYLDGVAPAPDTATDDDDPMLRQLWAQLRATPDAAAALAWAVRTRIPEASEFTDAGIEIGPDDPATRLWAALVATWLELGPRRFDSRVPVPTVLQWTRQREAREVIDTLIRVPPTLTALRLPLVDAVHIMARSAYAPSWRSLHHDLTHWTNLTSSQWRTAFWDRPQPDA